MSSLCPFFKEECHGNQCKMWHNEECLIVAFLQRIQEGIPTPEEAIPSPQEPIERTGMFLHREEEDAPEWLKIATPKTIAEDIIEFKDKEFPEQHTGVTLRARSDFRNVLRHYWSEKDVEKFLMPSAIQRKIEKGEMLAEGALLRKQELEKKARLENEKEELPSLISQFVEWSRLRSIKRATLPDVEAFVLEKEIDILKETKRTICTMGNAQLKSRQ
jgi:hypothetical protein